MKTFASDGLAMTVISTVLAAAAGRLGRLVTCQNPSASTAAPTTAIPTTGPRRARGAPSADLEAAVAGAEFAVYEELDAPAPTISTLSDDTSETLRRPSADPELVICSMIGK